jgi:hypothetical protein
MIKIMTGRGGRRAPADMDWVRAAVRELVETGKTDEWLATLPDHALVRLAAPLEMLTFQYYLDPPRDRHLVRAARVACATIADCLDDCPGDLAAVFRRLDGALVGAPAAGEAR